MHESLSEAIAGFDSALQRFDASIEDGGGVRDAVFEGAHEWRTLLRYKLVPHLEAEPCLVVAVAGGTNTGKSTIFNLLVQADASPVRATAAATCHPVLAVHPDRMDDALAGRIVAAFQPRRLENPEDVIGHTVGDDTLFVWPAPTLPHGIALLDTPDVDSIDKSNWDVADNIRAAGDILVAVLTGEKYKDDKVVAFFRDAISCGRIVLPIMNKADAENDFDTARRQLDEFRTDTGVEGPAFILEHDKRLRTDFTLGVPAAEGDLGLLAVLNALDASEIKSHVYRGTVERFGLSAGHFLAHVDDIAGSIDSIVGEFEQRTTAFAGKYEPAPGAAIGGLFHEYVQARRGPVRRFIGTTSTAVTKGAVKAGKAVSHALLRRATLETTRKIETDDDVRALHADSIKAIVRDLARGYVESAHNAREPAAELLRKALDGLDVEALIEPVLNDVLRAEKISEEFRAYALKMLDTWWNDHAGKRKVLEAMDGVLAVMPAAIAVPIAINTGGYGVAETVAVTGPLAEQFLARVIEYQFGDALFDFITPWQQEQQANLEAALNTHLTGPTLERLRHFRDTLQSEAVDELKKWQAQCLSVSATS